MFLQLLTKESDRNPHEHDGTAKDPKNPNAVALLLVAVTPAALPLLDARDPLTLAQLSMPLIFAALAIWLLITGLAAREVWEDSAAAPRPKVPCKILGCIALGCTAASLVLFHSSAGPTAAFTQGIIATVLALLAFGLDPLKDKGLDTSTDRARLAAQTQAATVKARLDKILSDVRQLDEYVVTEATIDLTDAINRLAHAVTLDPIRHRIARRHLGPMLDGVERSCQRFIALWTISPSADAMHAYHDLADQISVEYDRAAEAYARAGAVDLQVEADVLRHLIKREAA